MIKSKNILLLGCSGLISSVLADKLIDSGYNIDAAGRKSTENSELNFIKWDIFEDSSLLLQKLKRKYDAIIAAAWAGNKPDERNNAFINMSCAKALNSLIFKIIKYAQVDQIILMGSQAEYGILSGHVDEDSAVNEETISDYGKAKLYLYENLRRCVGNIVVTELRFHSVYGYFRGKKQMLESVMKDMFMNKDISFYSDGLHCYDFLYVNDAAEAIVSALEINESGVFNIGSDSSQRFCGYIAKLKEITGSKSQITYGNQKMPDFLFCSDKFRCKTGWDNRISFEEGALKMFSSVSYEILRNNNIIIYGAGYCGLVFSDILLRKNIHIKAFFDSDPEKQKESFNGVKISQASECTDPDDLVIVCMLTDRYYSEIREKLVSLGYKNIKYIYELSYMEELFDDQPLIFCMPERWQKENLEKIKLISSLFADDKSREVYREIIEFASGKHDISIDRLQMKEQYFAYDVYKKTDREVFIDCGAFRGDILEFFCENNNHVFKEYFAVEPDPANSKRIEGLQAANDERVHIIECALSDKPEILKMKNYLNENSVVSDEGFAVKADTLDNLCGEYNIVPTFIKIDVEGFEEKLIEGAERTIRKNKPVIAAAIYHKCDDLWKLPMKLHELLPSHRLFLRSYMNINETILYAVPEERLADEIYKKYTRC